MKKITRLALILILCFAVTTLCSGCEKENNASPIDLSIVTLNGQNMPSINPEAQTLQQSLNECVSANTGSSCSLIIADGSPYLSDKITFDVKNAKNNTYWEKTEKPQRVQQLIQLLTTHKAATEGTNLLEGIRLAGRQLQAGENKEKVLIIVHSGLNTIPPLSMQNTDLLALGDSTIQQLSENGYLANLENTEVHFLYLGDTAGRQEALSANQVQALKAFWDGYLKACGAKSVTFEDEVPTTSEVKDAPAVPVVTPDVPVDLDRAISLEEVVEFQPDTTILNDKEEAHEKLSNIAAAMTANPQKRYLLAGSTADVDDPLESTQRFGLQRAQVVRDLLGEWGVDENQLTIVGLGYANTSIRSQDDQKNRTVWLVPMEDDLAKEFLEVGLSE